MDQVAHRDRKRADQWLAEASKDVVVDLNRKFWAEERLDGQVYLEGHQRIDCWVFRFWRSVPMLGGTRLLRLKSRKAFFTGKIPGD